MPTPDGREWYTSEQLVSNMLDHMKTTHPSTANYIDLHREELETDLAPVYADLYGMEFKVCRLVEALKNAIRDEEYGPLGTEGAYTQAGEIYQTFKAIFTVSVLECYDENGNYIC
jgi:hypothetical protein